MASTDVVRALFDAYLAQDAEAAERLVADDFVFTSPQDDRIDRAAWFERCFPTADRVASQRIVEIVGTGIDGDLVFVMYEYELKAGGTYRNTEFVRVRDGQLVETQVFFGSQVPEPGASAADRAHPVDIRDSSAGPAQPVR